MHSISSSDPAALAERRRERADRMAALRPLLSSSEQSLWFIERLYGSVPVYHVHCALWIDGPLDAARLRAALHDLVLRHESLRTAYVDAGDGPRRVVADDAVVRMPLDDFTHLPEAGREAAVIGWAHAQVERAIDLTRAPLMHTGLARVSATRHLLVVVLHHIVSDGWSKSLLMRELGERYEARRIAETDEAAPVAPAAVQYADWAAWQRLRIESGELREATDWWKAHLAGVPALQLPTDRPRPPQASLRGGRVPFVLSASQVAALKTCARGERATPFMVALSLWQVLLSRWSGQTDFAVGTPVANRERPQFEAIHGYLVNTLALRADLSDAPSLRALVARNRETMLQAMSNQHVPFDRLVAEISPERDLSRNPVYQTSFALQSFAPVQLTLAGCTSSTQALTPRTAMFDLSLTLTPEGECWRGEVEYASDLFDEATAQRVAAQYPVLLAAALAEPERPVDELPLLGEDERRLVLHTWNDTARDYPLHRTLLDLVAEQVVRVPHAPAVVLDVPDASGALPSIDYATLDARANRLAHRLRARGVDRGQYVAVCLQRSLEMVVSMLAVLKAGAAFAPLDPDSPPERLASMLETSQAPVVLMHAPTRDKLPTELPAGCVAMAVDDVDPDAGPADPLPCANGPQDVVYLLFTSGSTGRPKGSMIPNRGVVNHLLWQIEQIGFTAADRIAQKTSISFDCSMSEVFLPLVTGSPVILARPGGQREMDYQCDLIVRHGITVFQVVPAALRALLDEPGFGACGTLRYLICGGEAMPRELPRLLAARLPQVRLDNYYGPSEASDDSTCFDTRTLGEGAAALRTGAVPIGKPIANARCLVLDAKGGLAPIGVAGELHIGGAGLAHGYVGRPDLTAERFVPDPCHPGERLYRTGDLVRWLPDGNLEYVGRNDFQVKLRGLRVELGEIEAVLAEQPGVTHALAMAREDRPGVQQLVAYVTGHAADGEALSPALLAEALRRRLPAWMVPSAIVPIDAFPLSPNGKIDRRALPAPGDLLAASVRVAPASPMEARLAALWAEVLGAAGIGVEDDFFALGGHSLLAVRLLARIEAEFGTRLRLASLFEAPTVHGQVRLIEAQAGARKFVAPMAGTQSAPEAIAAAASTAIAAHPSGASGAKAATVATDATDATDVTNAAAGRAASRDSVVTVNVAGDRPALFMVTGWGGQILPFRALGRALAADQPLYVLDTSAFAPREDGWRDTLQTMAATMIADMKRTGRTGPWHLAGFSFGSWVAYEIAQQLTAAGETVDSLVLMDVAAPGYPRMLPLPRRLAIHARRALAQGPSGLLAYCVDKVRWVLHRRLGDKMAVFERDVSLRDVHGAGITQDMEQAALVLERAVAGYAVRPYAGRLSLIRAARRFWRVGVIDDDPVMGWGTCTAAADLLGVMPCDHTEMLHAEHSPVLAALLRQAVDRASLPVDEAGARILPRTK